MIVDCHTHWGGCFQERDGTDPRRWLEVMDRHGVRHAVVLPEPGLWHAGRIPADNDTVVAACARSGGRMIPFCTVNTYDRREAMDELRRCLGPLRMRGIKFHPWLQATSPSTEAMDEVCEAAAESNVPILFHDGTPPFSLPSQIALLARRHPRVTIILGHAGLFQHWREAIAALRAVENLWGCLCGPYPAALREVLRRCDRQRLLWGSDFGFGFADSVGYRLGLMDRLGLTEEEKRQILEENPRRLFSLRVG